VIVRTDTVQSGTTSLPVFCRNRLPWFSGHVITLKKETEYSPGPLISARLNSVASQVQEKLILSQSVRKRDTCKTYEVSPLVILKHGTRYRPMHCFIVGEGPKKEAVWASDQVRTLWRTGKFAQVNTRCSIDRSATSQPSHDTDNYQSQITIKQIRWTELCLYLARANNSPP